MTTSDGLFGRLYKPLLAVAALVIVLWAVNLMSYVVTTLMFALFITILVAPYVRSLQRRGLSHRMALLLVMLLVLGVFIVFLLTIVFSVVDLIDTLPQSQHAFQGTLDAGAHTLSSLGVSISAIVSNPDFQAAGLIQSFVALLKSLAVYIGSALLILFVFVLFLLDADRVPTIVEAHFPGNQALTTFGEYSSSVRSYIVARSAVNLVVAILSAILLVLLGAPNPLLWGLALFILRFVPVIGLWLALIPITFTTLVVAGPQTALIACIGIAVISGITSNTLYYRLMGRGLNLSPAAMVVSLLFWTFLLGPLGAFLALPLTMLLKVMVLDDDAQMVSDIISQKNVESEPAP
jgi:AI-2 transport protein TqsA